MVTATKSPKSGSKSAKGKAKGTTSGREVLYPEIKAELRLGDNALTVTEMKEMLGWTEQPENEDWGDDYLLRDENNKKIRCLKNAKNRPFTESHARKLGQDVLSLNWADSRNTRPDDEEPMSFNGESIIVNRYGDVDSAQHREIGWVLAGQILTSDTKEGEHWRKVWQDAGRDPANFTVEALVVYGVSANPRVTRTLDNTRARTLADVTYTMDLFRNASKTDREKLTRALEYAIRTMWKRTGAKVDAFAPELTHSEALECINKHPLLKEEVKGHSAIVPHMFKECNSKAFKNLKVGGAGTAAGFFYLMAASASNPDKYLPVDSNGIPTDGLREESVLKLDNYDAAHGFWVDVCSGAKTMEGLREALASLSAEGSAFEDTTEVRQAMLVGAWNEYLKAYQETEGDAAKLTRILRNRITLDRIKPFIDNKQNITVPSCGGIDVGDPDAWQKGIKELREGGTPEEKAAKKKEVAREAVISSLNKMKEPHGGDIVILVEVTKEDGTKDYVSYHDDAEPVALAAGQVAKEEAKSGVLKVKVSEEKLQNVADKLIMLGRRVGVATGDDNNYTVTLMNKSLPTDKKEEPKSEEQPTPAPGKGKGKGRANRDGQASF